MLLLEGKNILLKDREHLVSISNTG